MVRRGERRVRVVTVQPHAARPSSHLGDRAGFWLWALVGAGLAFGLISFVVFFLIPPLVGAVLLARRSPWRDGPVLLGMVAGAGVPLLVVAALQWDGWHDRVPGDNTPNPYYWGGVGLGLLLAGIAAFAVRPRRAGQRLRAMRRVGVEPTSPRGAPDFESGA